MDQQSSRQETTGLRAILQSPRLALILATLLWSGNFIAGRSLRGTVDPVTLNFLRWMIAFLVMAPFVWRSAIAALPALRREWLLIFALGATGIVGFHILVYLALRSTTASNALLILSLAPIATLFGSALLGLRWPTRTQFAGALVSSVGAGILIARGDITTITSHGFNRGDLWMLLAVLIWAIYSLTLRCRPPDLSASVTLAASTAAGLAMMLPLLAFVATTPVAALGSVPVMLSIGYIALFASVIAFLLWSNGVSQLGPVRAGQFVQLMPVFGASLAFVLLDEVPTSMQIIGALLVLAGIAVVERTPGEASIPTKRRAFRTWLQPIPANSRTGG